MKKLFLYFTLAFFYQTAATPAQTVDLLGDEETAAPEANSAAADATAQKQDKAAVSTDYLDDYIDGVETEKKAQNTARALLSQKPKILNLRQNEIKSLKKLKVKTEEIQKISPSLEKIGTPAEQQETKEEVLQKLRDSLQAAPMGLYWAATQEQIQELGFELKPAERKDYKNVFQVLNPQQNNNTFALTTAIFGLQNKLWCIYAQGALLDDDAQASQVLALYRRYYEALSKKYGNAKEHFEPYTYQEQLIEGEGDKKKVRTVTKQNPLGGDNFLKELQEGKAVLYATFQNDEIGVTLGVSVDGDGKSSISIDYKNFALMDSEQQTVLSKTIEDL